MLELEVMTVVKIIPALLILVLWNITSILTKGTITRQSSLSWIHDQFPEFYPPEVSSREVPSSSTEITLEQFGFKLKRNIHFFINETCHLVAKMEQVDGTKLVGQNLCPEYEFDPQNVMKNGVCGLSLEFLPYNVHYEFCYCLKSIHHDKGCYSGQIVAEKVKQRPQGTKPIEFKYDTYRVCSDKCNL